MNKLLEEFGNDGASLILSEKITENLDNAMDAGILLANHIRSRSMDQKEMLTRYEHLFDSKVRDFILDNYDQLESMLVHERDYIFMYKSLKMLAHNYLFKIDGEPREAIQWCWMRVAVQVSMPNIAEVAHNYHILSKGEAIHATPTCVNAGYKQPQLESCFLIPMNDSMEGIQAARTLIAMGSKANGGFGLDCGNIRHGRVGNRGMTKGVPGLIKHEIDPLVSYADQLGSRPGAVTVFLPLWHIDIDTFIRMGDRKSPESMRSTNVNYSIWVHDLFHERRLNGEGWYLFCPRDTKRLWSEINGGSIDDALSLHDMWGNEFSMFYKQCERHLEGKPIDPSILWSKICVQRCQTGQPFVMNADACNRKSNHKNQGTITMSNLCQEIIQFTKPDEVAATCDLATINLTSFIREDGYDWTRLGEVTRQLVRNLNQVIDSTSGIVPNEGREYLDSILQDKNHPQYSMAKKMYPHIKKDITYTGRMMNRAIGIGKMGLGSLFSMLNMEYASEEACIMAETICACIYWHSVHESHLLAIRDGSYPSYDGSPISRGELQPDLWAQEDAMNIDVPGWGEGYLRRRTYDLVDPSSFGISEGWEYLRSLAKKGMRNSLLTCQMPNATTSAIWGVTPSIEPFFSCLHATSNVAGNDASTYHAVIDVAKSMDIYDPIFLAKYMSDNQGSIKGIGLIDSRYESMERLFTRAFDINKKRYFLMVQRMGRYICQSQSLNWFFELPNDKYMERLDTLLWANGAKTGQYYVHRKAVVNSVSDKTFCTSCQ